MGSAELPFELGVAVGSWLAGSKVAPRAGALMFCWRTRLSALLPTYEMSKISLPGSFCCRPTFQAMTRGGVNSYWVGASDSVG